MESSLGLSLLHYTVAVPLGWSELSHCRDPWARWKQSARSYILLIIINRAYGHFFHSVLYQRHSGNYDSRVNDPVASRCPSLTSLTSHWPRIKNQEPLFSNGFSKGPSMAILGWVLHHPGPTNGHTLRFQAGFGSLYQVVQMWQDFCAGFSNVLLCSWSVTWGVHV